MILDTEWANFVHTYDRLDMARSQLRVGFERTLLGVFIVAPCYEAKHVTDTDALNAFLQLELSLFKRKRRRVMAAVP